MKFVKKTLGIEELERRISSLERKVDEYENALTSISTLLRSQSIRILGMSENLRALLDSVSKRTSLKRTDQDETYN